MGFGSFKSNNPFRQSLPPPLNNNNNNNHNNNNFDDVPPPPGPPQSHRPAGAAVPGMNPPGQHQHQQQQYYAPPPGPPPSYTVKNDANDDNDFAPPPGPPPSHHDWQTAVPDTSLLPPPPDIFSGWERSPASNTAEAQAEAGESWCAQYPLAPPADPAQLQLQQLPAAPRLVAPPPGVFGRGSSVTAVSAPGPGASRNSWAIRTGRGAGDCCLVGYPHAYLARRDSPLVTGRPATIYFEARIVGGKGSGERVRRGDAGFAVGFQALPYPVWRMPGWHRGSLAVHGDDGHRYVNDRWGGKDFTEPFREGEVVGIGMVFSPVGGGGNGNGSGNGGNGKGKEVVAGAGAGIQVDVFFTRGGREAGRWDLHETLDAEQDLPVTGLEGYHDLAVAVGTFGQVEAEVILDPGRWLFKP